MKKSLTINATRNGKKVAKSFGFVNPDVANSLVGGFAQMVNALSNDTFVNAEVVKKMDTSEEDTSSQSQTPAAKTEPTLIIDTAGYGGIGSYTYNGDGDIFGYVEGYFLNIDRNDKTFTVIGHDDYTPYAAVSDYTITLYASETANFAAKSVSATFSSRPDTPVTPVTPGI